MFAGFMGLGEFWGTSYRTIAEGVSEGQDGVTGGETEIYQTPL